MALAEKEKLTEHENPDDETLEALFLEAKGSSRDRPWPSLGPKLLNNQRRHMKSSW